MLAFVRSLAALRSFSSLCLSAGVAPLAAPETAGCLHICLGENAVDMKYNWQETNDVHKRTRTIIPTEPGMLVTKRERKLNRKGNMRGLTRA